MEEAENNAVVNQSHRNSVNKDYEDESFYFAQISSLRKGAHILIRNRPCEIFYTSRFCKRKHSKPEYTVYGTDLFNDSMYEIARYDEKVKVPFVKRTLYKLLAVDGSFMSLLNEQNGEMETKAFDPNSAFGLQIRNGLNAEENKCFQISVIRAMDEEKIELMKCS